MTKAVPIQNNQGGFSCTLDLNLALANNYIGEVYVNPTPVAKAVARAVGRGGQYLSGIIYYYGTPDDALREKFDLPPEKKGKVAQNQRLDKGLSEREISALENNLEHLMKQHEESGRERMQDRFMRGEK